MSLKHHMAEVQFAIARANLSTALDKDYNEKVVEFLRERVEEAKAEVEEQKRKITFIEKLMGSLLEKVGTNPKPPQNFLPQNV